MGSAPGAALALPTRAVRWDRLASKDGAMEGLRWWLLLLTALMFSMSGCASG
jgi:hypothetical protein